MQGSCLLRGAAKVARQSHATRVREFRDFSFYSRSNRKHLKTFKQNRTVALALWPRRTAPHWLHGGGGEIWEYPLGPTAVVQPTDGQV